MEKAFLINILVIYGIHASTRVNMLLDPLRQWIERVITGKRFNPMKRAYVPDYRDDIAFYVLKVLSDCTPCMASLYGSIGFLFTDLPIERLPIWVFSLCGANYMLNKLLNR